MKKPVRIITSSILIISGIVAAVFGIHLILQSASFEVILGVVAILAGAIMIIMSGVQVAQGAKIRDILGDLFRGLGM